MSDLRVRRVGPAEAAGLSELFARTDSPCFCRYWHFDGDKNAWLDRCANRPDDNRAELEAALVRSDEQLQGVVAVDEQERVVGWMKLTPAQVVPKLFEQRLYKALPCFDAEREHCWVVGCFLIDEAHRRQGVAGLLLDAGLQLARAAGARQVEAFPRRADDVPAEQLWTGPFELYTKRGFRVVHDFAPYPVLRLVLEQAAAP